MRQIPLSILLCLLCNNSWATDWFKNADQQAQIAFEQKDYATSAQLFTDPYQRGVALYRNGQYAEAIEAFTSVTNPETKLHAQYNLGNAYFQQGDYQKAISAYEHVLAERPTHEDAKHNLALAKQQLESQQQDSSTNQSEETQDSSTKESEKNTEQSQKASANESEQNTEQSAQSSSQDEQQSGNNAKPQDQQSENKKIAEQSPTEQEATSAISSSDLLPSEEDVMAEVLLNRLEENPQRLLRNQFYLDAQQAEVPPPTQTW